MGILIQELNEFGMEIDPGKTQFVRFGNSESLPDKIKI